MRRFLACLVIVALVTSSGGCSQPVDTGSPVPAQSQPIVALLALVGLAIGLTAFIHHQHNANPQPPAITGPKLFVKLSAPGTDMNVADVTSSVIAGAIQAGASTTYQQATVPSGGSVTMAGFFLPASYNPTALAIDPAGNVWFDDDAGNVKRCPAPVGTSGTCAPTLAFADGLGVSGTRSMDADGTNVYFAIDNGTGKVVFAQFSISSGTSTGSGSNTATSLLVARDALTSTTFLNVGAPGFIAFRADASSFLVQNGIPSANSFKLNPVPLDSEGVSEDPSLNAVYFGALGSPVSGPYQIARYNNTGVEQASITIARDGTTADSRFAVPLRSLRADHSRNTYALDANGNIVVFAAF